MTLDLLSLPMMHDYRLGLRMLVKFPGLTIAGGLALAVAIGVGAGWYDLSRDLFAPTLPLPEGDRIILIATQNVVTGEPETRVAHDFLEWRRTLRTVEDLGAYHSVPRNVVVGDRPPMAIQAVELTAAAFRTARVVPMIGRGLLDADEISGAPNVVVIGYDLWQRAFDARPDAIGSVVKFGDTSATVVGIMPEAFRYPVNHVAWLPLRLRGSYDALDGGPITVIGRLAPGVTQEQADAEVHVLGQRAAATNAATHEHLQPRVVRPGPALDVTELTQLALTNGPVFLVLLIACLNVGTLVYARTATREGEIALRSALGASRGQIVLQLFVEALVLALLAAAVGLIAADRILTWGIEMVSSRRGGTPFWMTPGLDAKTILYATALAIISAAIVSLLPAVRATRARLHSHLANLGGGGSTLRFGGVWTAAMIAQVALTVIALPIAGESLSQMWRKHAIQAEFPSGQYFAARIELDRSFADEATAAFGERRARTFAELERRLRLEPGVTDVTFANGPPGAASAVRVADVEASAGTGKAYGDLFWTSAVGPGFFETFERDMVAGRAFDGRDRNPAARTVIVNETFARRFDRTTHRGSPVGTRLRYRSNAAAAEPWFEIVGVVRDLGLNPEDRGPCCEEASFVYHAASAETTVPFVMSVRLRSDPAALSSRLPRVAASVDAGLRVEEAGPLKDWIDRRNEANGLILRAQAGVTLLALFLSALGIYSLMSVSVSRRTREIGLRAALGAGPRDVLVSVMTRAAALLGVGIAAGGGVLLVFTVGSDEFGPLIGRWAAFTAAVMLLAGIVASLGPARRALRINPTDALRES